MFNHQKLYNLVEITCRDLNVKPQRVIDDLLSDEDDRDIIAGDTPVECLRLHIETWIKKGMPRISGKPVSNEKTIAQNEMAKIRKVLGMK